MGSSVGWDSGLWLGKGMWIVSHGGRGAIAPHGKICTAQFQKRENREKHVMGIKVGALLIRKIWVQILPCSLLAVWL